MAGLLLGFKFPPSFSSLPSFEALLRRPPSRKGNPGGVSRGIRQPWHPAEISALPRSSGGGPSSLKLLGARRGKGAIRFCNRITVMWELPGGQEQGSCFSIPPTPVLGGLFPVARQMPLALLWLARPRSNLPWPGWVRLTVPSEASEQTTDGLDSGFLAGESRPALGGLDLCSCRRTGVWKNLHGCSRRARCETGTCSAGSAGPFQKRRKVHGKVASTQSLALLGASEQEGEGGRERERR